jgi:Na+-translocating ferredoxin:NAD+ oxidoreductase subunit G
MRDFVKMIGVLFISCGLAAASLAVVNAVTRERIAHWDTKTKEDALRAVMADADEFKEVKANEVWEARRNGQKAGEAFLIRINGYSGPITLMFGVGLDGTISGLQVLSHTETPGLGAKIVLPNFRDQFNGKRLEDLKLKKDGGQIDAITGATISSRAVTKAVYSTLDSSKKENSGGGK